MGEGPYSKREKKGHHRSIYRGEKKRKTRGGGKPKRRGEKWIKNKTLKRIQKIGEEKEAHRKKTTGGRDGW